MTRAKKNSTTKEDIKHVPEELWGLTPEETPHKIFSREDHLGIKEVFSLPNEEMHDISHKTEDVMMWI